MREKPLKEKVDDILNHLQYTLDQLAESMATQDMNDAQKLKEMEMILEGVHQFLHNVMATIHFDSIGAVTSATADGFSPVLLHLRLTIASIYMQHHAELQDKTSRSIAAEAFETAFSSIARLL